MDAYFAFEYAGTPFVLFGAAHLGTIAVLSVAAATFLRAGRRADERRRRSLRRWLAAVLLVNEASWHAWNAWFGVWEPERMLPLHLCSIMIWFSIVALWTGRRSLYIPVYFLGVAGALQAVITPDAGLYGFPHFRFFQTMIAHGGLVIAGFWVVLAERVVPTARDASRVLVALNIYALAVYGVNLLVGSNYLYVNGKPESASLIDVMPAWPWYIPVLEGMAIVLFAVLLVPFVWAGAFRRDLRRAEAPVR